MSERIATLLFTFGFIIAAPLAGCSEGEGGSPGALVEGSEGAEGRAGSSTLSPELRQAADVHRELLAGLAEGVLLPTYRDFVVRAESLQSAAEVYHTSLAEADLEALQAAWHEAMDVWQWAEVFQIGPASPMAMSLGGEDRRSEIYSWPTVNACRVDQELVEDAHADPSLFAEELVNVRGLDAMEYLLFSSSDDNACKSTSAINKDGVWAARLDAGELPARRAAYLYTLSLLVAEQAKELLERWEPTGGNFSAELSSAGLSSSTYASAHEALNAISDAMFYVAKQTKDMKVAYPAGISGCEALTCPESLESLYAGRSKENVLANLRALQSLYHGGADASGALGFDDILDEMGASALAADFSAALGEAVDTLALMEGSFSTALSHDPDAMTSVYEAIKAVSDLLKTEFVSTLDLEIPNRAAGDND